MQARSGLTFTEQPFFNDRRKQGRNGWSDALPKGSDIWIGWTVSQGAGSITPCIADPFLMKEPNL
jgi:hypothetical protein